MDLTTPKIGSFEALGWETGVPILLSVSILGIAQFFLLLLLSQLGAPYVGVAHEAIFPSILVLVASLFIFVLQNVKLSSPNSVRRYKVSFLDRRDEGGELELTYQDDKGVRRDHAIVRSLKGMPSGLVLGTLGRGADQPVPYASAAFVVRFKNRRGGLALGFDSFEEMSSFYSKLKAPGDPVLRDRDEPW